MDRQRIISFVNQLFEDVPKSKLVIEQKEELRSHMEERIADYMANGVSFEDAFNRAKDDLGDVGELVKEFDNKGSSKKKKKRKKRRNKGFQYTLTALAPFIYVGLGLLIPGWQIWAVGWIIIPVIPIIETFIKNRSLAVLVGLTPFIYVGLGILIGGWFWAWGWMIIPVAGIILGTSWPRVTIDTDDEDESDESNFDIEPEPYYDDRKN